MVSSRFKSGDVGENAGEWNKKQIRFLPLLSSPFPSLPLSKLNKQETKDAVNVAIKSLTLWIDRLPNVVRLKRPKTFIVQNQKW